MSEDCMSIFVLKKFKGFFLKLILCGIVGFLIFPIWGGGGESGLAAHVGSYFPSRIEAAPPSGEAGVISPGIVLL